MTVRLNPCFGCPIKVGCDLRAAWSAKISGLGLRSVWFNCDRLAAELRVGRRIIVAAPVSDGYGYDSSVVRKNVNATITAVDKGHRFACVIDPGQITDEELIHEGADIDKIRFWKYRHHWRIAGLLDEPDCSVCKFGNLKRDGKCDFRADKADRCACDDLAETERHMQEFIA